MASGTGGFLAPGVMTFPRLVELALGEADVRVRPLAHLGRRRLLQRVVDEALTEGQLQYFAAVAETGGFVLLVEELIAELKRQGVTPKEFLRHRGRGVCPISPTPAKGVGSFV